MKINKEQKLRVLHLCDIASVASTLAYYQKRAGYKANVFTVDSLDSFKFSKLYPSQTTVFKNFKTLLVCALAIAKFYDVIHIHYYGNLLKWFKRLFPKKCLVLHCHGSDIRYQKEAKKHQWERADFVAVSTPDLKYLYSDFSYVPNPVDTIHFKRTNAFTPGTALLCLSDTKNIQTLKLAKREAAELSLELTVHNREQNPISYSHMPSLLERFEYFIDIKQEPLQKRILDAMSLTALQALSMQTKVIHNHRIFESFPAEHSAENVVNTWKKIYEELL